MISELLSLEPTMSEYQSKNLLLEIMHREGWRCYPEKLSEENRDLAVRFLTYHSTVPGFISEELRSREPLAVFYFAEDKGGAVKGGVFKNGCVMVAHDPEGVGKVSLFIDEADAQRLNYPDEGYIYMPPDLETNKPNE